MNTKFLTTALITIAGFAAAPSYAVTPTGGEVGDVPQVGMHTSTTTRETVRAQYLQAQRNGQIVATGEGADLSPVVMTGSMVSRDAVRADAVHAARAGQLPGGEV